MKPLNAAEKEAVLVEAMSVSSDVVLSVSEERVLRAFQCATPLDWENYQWQLKNRINSKEVLEKVVALSPEEKKGIDKIGNKLMMSITPYFASRMLEDNPSCPVRMQSIPSVNETIVSSDEMRDPCGEENYSPVHGLVHRYPDRVLFLVSESCAMYCRFCTRSRMVGDGHMTLNKKTYNAAFEYIRANKQIRDVLISGGDPLMLSNDLLEYIIQNIKSIPHVEFVRIGTRMPVTLPQRIDRDLVDMLKKYSPIWMSIHFNHFAEISERVKGACGLLVDNGIPLGSQTVLLKGINDSPDVMKKLMHELLKIRVKPYYIYQCDPIVGSKHFRTPVSSALDIMKSLSGFTTGYAVPTYVIDAPGGGGKIPVSPNYVVSRKDGVHILKNYEGKEYIYHDPL